MLAKSELLGKAGAEYSRVTTSRVSEQWEYGKTFLRVYQGRLNRNLTREMARASAESAALREHPREGAGLEAVRAWLRERVKTIWPRVR